MDKTNESYVILLHTGKATERYYRDPRSANDKQCWVKVSTRGNEFRATAEQVLNHLLPALAGLAPGVTVEVQHHPKPRWGASAPGTQMDTLEQTE